MNRRSGEETRRKILETAVRVFTREGYGNASMRMIAGETGISVGGLYLYFRSKEELYVTLMEEWMTELISGTTALLETVTDPREAIRAFISFSIGFALGHREIVLLQGKELGCCLGMDIKRSFFRT